jgi:mannose-6-phosphate isomerase-like protein (cupin superfamily)
LSRSAARCRYLGDPPERVEVQPGGLIHVEPGTELQTANHGHTDLLIYVYGTPPETNTPRFSTSRSDARRSER